MSTSVKRIENTMRGVPALNGTAGTLVAALNTLFVTGWGVTTPLSVNVAGGIATATLTPGETFDRDSVVLIGGATPGALNGEARVLTTSNTSITWATTAPDGAASGSITIRYAPQTSWTEVYAATNKRAYRSTHVQSSGHHLRVDDTGTISARVRGYETMTDVDTGVGPFPTEAQQAGGGYWHKSAAANATAVKYRIFCDERFILFCAATNSNAGALNTSAPSRGFGDPVPQAPGGDAWCTVLSCAGSGNQGLGSFDQVASPGASNGGIFAPRAISGLGGALMVHMRPYSGTSAAVSGADNWLGPLPSEVDGTVQMSPVFVADGSGTKPPRARIPGLYYIPQTGAVAALADGDVLAGAGALAGRRLMVVHTATTGGAQAGGAYLVDITGPWR